MTSMYLAMIVMIALLMIAQTKLLQGIGVFGRFGCADPMTNPIKNFYSIGLAGRGKANVR